MDIKTHQQICKDYSGEPLELQENYAKVKLITTDIMKLDDRGLIHGGYIFSLADYAAMLAINKPTVVLGGANCRFLVPIKVGDELIAVATLINVEGKKMMVDVHITRGTEVVFIGEFYCFTPDKHVLG